MNKSPKTHTIKPQWRITTRALRLFGFHFVPPPHKKPTYFAYSRGNRFQNGPATLNFGQGAGVKTSFFNDCPHFLSRCRGQNHTQKEF
jgi:hypothetical protein